MYQTEYERTLERVKSGVELAKDCSNISRCEANLRYYNRDRAWACLQDMIKEYAVQIDAFGSLTDGVHVTHGVPLDQFSDRNIQDHLWYLMRHIPVYVLLKEGQKELANQMCRWLDQGKHNI